MAREGEQSADSETTHASEAIGYFAIGDNGLLSGVGLDLSL